MSIHSEDACYILHKYGRCEFHLTVQMKNAGSPWGIANHRQPHKNGFFHIWSANMQKKTNKCQKYANRMAACYFSELRSDCTMYIELNWIKLFLDIDTMLLSYFIECWKIQKLSYDQIQSVMWMHILCFVHFEVDLQATFHRFIGAQCTLHSHTLNIYVQATHQPMDIKCWFFESQESAFVWKTMDSQLAGIWEIDQ